MMVRRNDTRSLWYRLTAALDELRPLDLALSFDVYCLGTTLLGMLQRVERPVHIDICLSWIRPRTPDSSAAVHG